MKKTLLLFLIVLLPLTAAATYNPGDTFKIEGEQFNLTGVSSSADAVFFASEHGTFAIRDDDCIDRDIYLLCVENVSDDIVEHYPDRYEITFTWEKLCKECIAWGKECTNETADLCENACVHGTCRPKDPWCGDTFCDSGETTRTCAADCPDIPENQTQEPEEENTSEPATITNPEPYENVTQETQRQDEQQASGQDTNDSTEPSTQEPVDGPAAQIVSDDANWLGAGIVIFGGLIGIFVIFNNKKKKKEDLYSYRK